MSTEHSDQLDQLATALAAAQAEFTAIPKTADNPFFKSKYADLASVVEKASEVATKHGLSVAQMLGCDDRGDTMTTWVLHKSGQFIAETMRLHLTKDDAQGHGSAVTYARRYAYMAALGLVADEDDDGNRASSPQRSQRPQRVQSNGARAVLGSEAVDSLYSAIKSSGRSGEWVRMQLVGLGVTDVPQQVTKGTLRGLSERQAERVFAAITEQAAA